MFQKQLKSLRSAGRVDVAGVNMDLSLETIYKDHHGRVFGICLRMLKNIPEAEDLTQEVFIKLHRKISLFRGDSALSTWIHRVTVNEVLMYMRTRAHRMARLIDDVEIPDQVMAGTSNPARMRVVDKIAIDKAISQLAKGYRQIFILHDVEGFDHEEIGRLLKCSSGTSKSQLAKARRKMQKLLTAKTNPRVYSPRPMEFA